MSARNRIGVLVAEALRTERGESVVWPAPSFHENYDPVDSSDHGPHVDRVGLVAVDDFAPEEDAPDEDGDDPAPESSARNEPRN